MSFTPAERQTLIGAMAAVSLVPLNSTMIAVALPAIAEDFGLAAGRTAVLVTAYLVVMMVLQPVAGRVGDRVGTRRSAVSALVGFGLASVLAAVATSFALLLIARVLQAVAGAALSPNVQALVRANVADDRRGRAFGVLGAGIGVGAAAGPVVGGVLLQAAGWPAMFWASGAITIAAFFLLVRVRSAPAADAATFSLAPLTRAPFIAACTTQGAMNLAMYTTLLIVPVLLTARRWGEATIGLALLGLTAGLVILGPVGGWVGDRVGRRPPVVAGSTVAVAGTALVATMGVSSPVALVFGLVGMGAGMGFASASLQTAALESVPVAMSGSAAGVLSTSRYVGSTAGTIAIAVLMGQGTTGAESVLLLALAGAVVAVAAATRIESRAAADADQPNLRQ